MSFHTLWGAERFVLLSAQDVLLPTRFTLCSGEVRARNPLRNTRRTLNSFKAAHLKKDAIFLEYNSPSQILRQTQPLATLPRQPGRGQARTISL